MSTDETDESTSSTLILERSPQSRCSTPEVEQLGETTESLQNQERHDKTLQEMYKTKARPNQKDVSQLLDLEFQARRAYRLMLLRSRTGQPRYFKFIPASENWIILQKTPSPYFRQDHSSALS
ncbi:uncharacterized protein LOC127907905 [Oncorhynchus keta]|uniref:uncharacterized protein LOC127907905 n=1 Tax=Oncorhynchus keta TaxID=8018 RepID=UPI00227BED20|nr:uncharacterized protein LOC127907905 [Oncorhynchus keta]